MRVPRFVLNIVKRKLMPISGRVPDEIIGPGYRWRRSGGVNPNGTPLRPNQRFVRGLAKPFLRRWFVIPKNKWCNIYLHEFIRDDEERALHDHPWWNISLLLVNGYVEVTPGRREYESYREPNSPTGIGWRYTGRMLPDQRKSYQAGDLKFRSATAAHRIELIRTRKSGHKRTKAKRRRGQPSWSLFITGPVTRTWGFHCASGWQSSQEFHINGGCND